MNTYNVVDLLCKIFTRGKKEKQNGVVIDITHMPLLCIFHVHASWALNFHFGHQSLFLFGLRAYTHHPNRRKNCCVRRRWERPREENGCACEWNMYLTWLGQGRDAIINVWWEVTNLVNIISHIAPHQPNSTLLHLYFAIYRSQPASQPAIPSIQAGNIIIIIRVSDTFKCHCLYKLHFVHFS